MGTPQRPSPRLGRQEDRNNKEGSGITTAPFPHKPVILLVDSAQELPFDTIDQNHIVNGDEGKIGAYEAQVASVAFKAALEIVLAPGFQPTSPVTSADLRAQIASIPDAEGRALAEIRGDLDPLHSEFGRFTRAEAARFTPAGRVLTPPQPNRPETGNSLSITVGAAGPLSTSADPYTPLRSEAPGTVGRRRREVRTIRDLQVGGHVASGPLKCFVSYSHTDEAFKDDFVTSAAPMIREEVLLPWTDRDLLPGDTWAEEIASQLKSADVIVLLVSPDFLASYHCYEKETEEALQRHARGEAVVVPVIIRESDWQQSPFATLQALPKNARPVKAWADHDKAWLDVVQGLRKLCERLTTTATSTSDSGAIQRQFDAYPAVIQEGPDSESYGADESQHADGKPSSVATLKGHKGAVYACAVAPDGSYIVSASDDKTLRMWHPATGKKLHTLKGHTTRVNACAVAPDGSYIVSASSDRTLRLPPGLLIRSPAQTLRLRPDRSLTYAASDDGVRRPARLVPLSEYSVRDDKTLRMWDPATGKKLRTLKGHKGAVYACAVAPDGSYIVSASADETLRMWDPATGKKLRTLKGHTDEVNACAVAPDGSYIVSASDDETLRKWR